MTESVRETALQTVFQELVAAAERPDAATLEDFTRRYPQFTAEITEFAVEWVLQDELPVESEQPTDEGTAASAVPAAMQRFQQRLDELASASEFESSAADPFVDLSAARLGRMAGCLGLDKTLMAKLRDCKIVAESIPDELCKNLATELEVPMPVVVAHLTGPATIHQATSFKASGKPEAPAKETFAEAVRRSALTESDKNRWLACKS